MDDIFIEKKHINNKEIELEKEVLLEKVSKAFTRKVIIYVTISQNNHSYPWIDLQFLASNQ